jgi:hypothetical protein
MTFIFEWWKQYCIRTSAAKSDLQAKPPRVMFCLLYSPKTPKQKIVKFHTQKQIGKSHVIDIFTSEDMENISLKFWMEFSVGRTGDRHLSLTPKTHCFTCVIQNVSEFVAVGKHSGFPEGKCCVVLLFATMISRQGGKRIFEQTSIFFYVSQTMFPVFRSLP